MVATIRNSSKGEKMSYIGKCGTSHRLNMIDRAVRGPIQFIRSYVIQWLILIVI